MNENSTLKSRFNNEAERSPRESRIHDRVAGAIARMNERFDLCAPALTQTRYRDLLMKQGASPELKPSFATDNPQQRMWKAATRCVQYEHLHRINKIRKVGERMIGKDRGLER